MIYEKRCKKLRKYAREFCDTVNRDFKRLAVPGCYPGIKFYRGFLIFSKEAIGAEIAETTEAGEPLAAGRYYNGCIEIFGITRVSMEELKSVVRHECLHYLLDRKGLPYKDKDNLFILLAIKYNARPTGILADPEKWGLSLPIK